MPGTALDPGCGEGGDVISLVRLGWRVTAVDVSPTALERGSALADRAGVEDHIEFEQHDLTETLPAASFDLVSAGYFHCSMEVARERVLHRASGTVAPGGLLLVVDHADVVAVRRRRK